MSETGSPTTPAEGTAPEKKEEVKAPPAITKEDIASATSDAVKLALEEVKVGTDKVIAEGKAREDAHLGKLSAIAQAAGGGEAPNADKQFLEAFVRNPLGILDETIRTAENAAVARVNKDKQFDNAIAAEFAKREAVNIEDSAADKKAIGAYYNLTDENLPDAERLTAAIKQHDDYLETLGLGNLEARVKAASSMPSKNASAPGESKESSFNADAELKKELQGNADRHNRAMNITD